MASKKRSNEHLDEGGSAKKKRSTKVEPDYRKSFKPGLFQDQSVESLQNRYASSRPYLHGVINELIEPDLLSSVREEIIENLSFAPKETDIYKIHQTGDLANLDGLDDSSLDRLPSLLKLRNALYSPVFRSFLSEVTGAGPLSGKKTDMSINIYTPGCHLLCHDDVIGSRRISYILYLTDPNVPWIADWGGALRLYSTKPYKTADHDAIKLPDIDHISSILPEWNQLSFFAVQPGESFHDVQEVLGSRIAGDNLKRVRMSISGWYHIPQQGEVGYEEGLDERLAATSSLAQLQGKDTEHDLPQPNPIPYPAHEASTSCDQEIPAVEHDAGTGDESVDDIQPDSEEDILTEAEIRFLLDYLSPTYLTPDTMDDIKRAFNESSAIRLDKFLSEEFAEILRNFITEQPQTLSHLAKTAQKQSKWNVARPPHKHRYMYLLPFDADPNNQNLLVPVTNEVSPFKKLISELLPSLAFRKWLHIATDLKLTSHDVRARRFRRGHDYTLATTYEEEHPRLELTLGITPSDGWEENAEEDEEEENLHKGAQHGGTAESKETTKVKDRTIKANAKSISDAEKNAEQKDNIGGYEIYMASDSPTSGESTSDPAVYQSASKHDDDDDGILFTMSAGWNRLSLVLRDRGVMRFVKYVSAKAGGDRWDVVGEYEVKPEDEDDDEVQEDEHPSEEGGEEPAWNGLEATDDDESSTDLAEAAERELDSESD